MLEILVEGFDIKNVVGNVFYVVLILIGFDVLTGLLASAKERHWNSSVNFEGMLRKVGELVALMFVTFCDVYFEAQGYITKIGVGLIVIYEGLSIIENLARVGVKLDYLTKYFDPNKVGGGRK